MLDRDLALLYEVETKVLNRAVKRNLQRFPSDFMFELAAEEAENLRCQIWRLKKGTRWQRDRFLFARRVEVRRSLTSIALVHPKLPEQKCEL